MPILGQKYRHLDMSWLLIGHNRTAKVQIYLLIIKCFEKKVFSWLSGHCVEKYVGA